MSSRAAMFWSLYRAVLERVTDWNRHHEETGRGLTVDAKPPTDPDDGVPIVSFTVSRHTPSEERQIEFELDKATAEYREGSGLMQDLAYEVHPDLTLGDDAFVTPGDMAKAIVRAVTEVPPGRGPIGGGSPD